MQVAGKTGTAQAKYKGREDTISWFVCWAPFDNPKYTVSVMVQGGEPGGSVACPIAARIMERSLAMDEGKFEAQVAWLPPAHKANPFQMIKEVSFRDSGIDSGSGDEENASGWPKPTCRWRARAGTPTLNPKQIHGGKVAPASCCGCLGPRGPGCGASASAQLFSAAFRNEAPARTASTAAARAEAAQYHKMNLRSQSLPQLVSAARLMTGQPLHFYDRQSEKDFGSSFAQDRQQARSERRELETRVALLEGGRLEEYSVERKSSRNIVGSVYKGKVKNIEMGLKAMFVDIGFEKNAFLHFWDAIPAALDSGIEEIDRKSNKRPRKRITVKDIPSIYPVGSDVIVQVTKGPTARKGPARHNQSQFRRAVFGPDAIQRPQRYLSKN